MMRPGFRWFSSISPCVSSELSEHFVRPPIHCASAQCIGKGPCLQHNPDIRVIINGEVLLPTRPHIEQTRSMRIESGGQTIGNQAQRAMTPQIANAGRVSKAKITPVGLHRCTAAILSFHHSTNSSGEDQVHLRMNN